MDSIKRGIQFRSEFRDKTKLGEAAKIETELQDLADPAIAGHSSRFFKTAPGEYGAGNVFLGIRVPVLRKVAAKNRFIDLHTAVELLHSDYHEIRLTALLIMVEQFKHGDARLQTAVYCAYLANTAQINNWDLVDSSAHLIVGPYLEMKDRRVLYRLAASENLWERRIAIMATFHYIRRDSFDETLKLAEILLNDPHDLIHKAVGWMLREVGKRDMARETNFLDLNYQKMPRTMLRYAIERFLEPQRQAYLRGTTYFPESKKARDPDPS
ncbi:MAG: DNA alkylation repair protein [Desulfocapsaceae bacterium]